MIGAAVLVAIALHCCGWTGERLGRFTSSSHARMLDWCAGCRASLAAPSSSLPRWQRSLFLWHGSGYHVARLPAVVASVNDFRTQHAGTSATGIAGRFQAKAADVAASVGDWLPGMFGSLARNLTWALVNWSIALLGLYYLLGSASEIWPRFARLLPLSPAGAESLRTRFRDITQGMVAGTLLSAAIQGVSIGTGFWVAGLPDPLFWGACAASRRWCPFWGMHSCRSRRSFS
jgi:predicted PurR-regulated permease PerM